MFQNKATQLTERDCLISLKNDCLMQTVVLKLDIEILKTLPEDTVIGEKSISPMIAGIQGKQAIKAKEAIEFKQKQLFANQKKLEILEKMLKV